MELIGSIAGRCLLLVLVVMTVLPLWRVGSWPVRLCDFFRLQISVLAIGLLLAFLIVAWQTDWSYELGAGVLLAVLIAGWQISHFVRYTPLWPLEVSDAPADARPIRLAVVNLKVENQAKQSVVQQLQDLEVDLLLLIEFNAAWAEALSTLEDQYPHRQGVEHEDGVGLMLWSQLPLENAEVRYLVSESRPSIFTQISVDEHAINYVGLHPLPPGLPDDEDGGRHDSNVRDAELMLVADIVAKDPDASWIVSGDFNDVAWSRTTRLFQRISGLKDPRVGRGFYNTYHAEYPWIRFPIDQVFVSSNGRIAEMGRFHPAGSDHFAITATISFVHQPAANPTASPSEREDAEEMVEKGLEDAT
ncbi:hypothetical protein Q31a_35560 [Aureliella helgolandensis]|uniref:Endonuclease/exonuclease/phosphatase domain-containing protein n=2 Tax=Aureliella helgolandensis TaxID=2527968 RepID=A0A518G9I2_9BACT|nr:hypothetical protein Q31a_35560 [Aureliella helgolandensis]